MPRKPNSMKVRIESARKMNAIMRSRRASKKEGKGIATTSAQKNIDEDLIERETLSESHESAGPSVTIEMECKGNVPTVNAQIIMGEDSVHKKTSSEPQQSVGSEIGGRRIIDVMYFYSKLQEISNHGPMSCGLGYVKIIGERQVGLRSTFKLECNMCNKTFFIESDRPEEINVNHSAVAGIIAIGCGHSQLEELSAALNLPIMSPRTYKTCHFKISAHWEKISVQSMNEAAEKERELAMAEGRVDKNGIPIIDVIVDGCWCKRTYKKNYSALSGAAAIIGKRTGQVLFLGVKNKYCSICAQAQKKNVQPKHHICYKNYNGPSTAMESEILVEGFRFSIEMHNLIYGRMVSDGDSSTYSKLLKSRPYPHISVEKIECRNHLLRNLCNKLTSFQTDTKYLLKFRKMITQKKIMILRKTIRKIIKSHKADTEHERRSNIEPLYSDILLAHLHAFGDHSKCKTFFCNLAESKSTEGNRDFFTSTLWSRICLLVANLASQAPSLIHDIDSNTVERYNSIVAKLVGGKRINFSKRGSYQTRCHAAVVSFNTHKVMSSLYKSIGGHSPRGNVNRLENQRIKRMMTMRKNVRTKNRLLFSKGEDINYGEKCDKPDMPPDIFEKEKQTFLQNLVKTKEEKTRIERDTILQSSCSEWLELRRNILTASKFGKIIKRRDNISCENIVKDILYKQSIAHVKSIKHGKDNEQKALRQLEIQQNVKINPCGLFIDDEYNYLGATPDGVIDEETIVEIKCPITAYKKNIIDVVKSKKLPFYKINQQDELIINKTHLWYYQVQGQLHITKKQKCLFAIWCGENYDIKTEVIMKDDNYWEHKMKPKLIKFYTECLLPELVDPRFPRNLKIRDPTYILEAIKEKEKKVKMTKRKHKENDNRNINQENAERSVEQENEERSTKNQNEIQKTEDSPLSLEVLAERNCNNDYVKELKFKDF